jgi:hypothetical protein
MFDVLNSYLFQHRSVSIPGMGTIYLESLPASIDNHGTQLLPPLYYFRFDKYFDAPDKEFFAFLSSQLGLLDFEAIRRYTEFSFNIREQMDRNGVIDWKGVGALKKDSEGNVSFESSLGNPVFLQPVPANRVIHPDARHVLLVGDTERTNIEMNQWLQQEEVEEKKDKWWIYALILGAVSLMIILIHFSSSHWRSESIGNQQVLKINK